MRITVYMQINVHIFIKDITKISTMFSLSALFITIEEFFMESKPMYYGAGKG